MGPTRGRWASFAALVAGAAAFTALVSVPGKSDFTTLAVAGAAAIGCLAVAALSWTRYRAGRDPRDLFVAAAFAVLAVQGALFGVGWPLANDRLGFFGILSGDQVPEIARVGVRVNGATGAAGVYAWQVGWILACSLLVLGSPWEDRRGRAPVSPLTVLGGSIAMLGAADLLLLWLALRAAGGRFARTIAPVDLGILGWVFALTVTGLAVLAAARTWGARFGVRPSRAWLTVAYLLAASLAIVVALHPTPGTLFVQPGDLLGVVIPALVFVGLLIDQRTAASRQRRTTDRAEEVLGGRAEIASMIAHEVRGPAATVRGIAGTSLANYDRLSDDERREFLGMIEQESRRLMGTVDQMSLALKIDAGSLRLSLMPQDLEAVVRAGVEAVGAAEGRVDVDAEAEIVVSADRTRLAEVVRQLVDNAAKYSPPGQSIRVRTYREGRAAVVEIADRGSGIPAGEREHVFEKFPNWRPPGYEERPGTGLGLFICRGLIAEHSGEISVEGEPDGGTMLRVRLPAEG